MISADTNLFVYAIDGRDKAKHAAANRIVTALGGAQCVVGLQVVGELQNALRRRLRIPPWVAYQAARNLMAQFPTFAYDEAAVEFALGEGIVGRLAYWDALLMAAAAAAGAGTLISEDMTDGLVVLGVEVIHPFGPDGPSQRVRALLGL